MKKAKIHRLKINFEIPVSPTLKLPRFVYLFVVEGDKLHFIDTGVAPAFGQVENFLKNIRRNFSDIQNIFLTHSHPDHIGAAKLIQEKTKYIVHALQNEKNWIEDTNLQCKVRPVPGFQQLVAGSVKLRKMVKLSSRRKIFLYV